jgi:hypothetical protein
MSDAPALDMSGICAECGYDMTRLSNDAIVDLIASFSLEEFLPLSRVRPTPEVWSPLEYAWHLRESFDFYRDRITLVLSVDAPQFEGGDFTVDPVETPGIVEWLHQGAKAVSALLRSLDDAHWERFGIGSYDGGRRDIRNLASRLAHECVHHAMDIARFS